MEYRVIITSNGKYKKTLHKSKTRETAFINYHRIKETNKVFYPKKFINTKAIKPVKYEICVSKTTEQGDIPRTLRDDYGKLYTEPYLGDWTIIDSAEYLIEETFWIYGFDSKKKRPNISEIVKKLMTGAHSKRMVKEIIVAHNKVLIYNEEQFEMIICKNLEDAQRLHHTLSKIAQKQKIKSLMFMGTAGPVMTGKLYDMIHKKTKWPYPKIRRTSTRP
jgi:hypothetical protein